MLGYYNYHYYTIIMLGKNLPILIEWFEETDLSPLQHYNHCSICYVDIILHIPSCSSRSANFTPPLQK